MLSALGAGRSARGGGPGGDAGSGDIGCGAVRPRARRTFADTIFSPHASEIAQHAALSDTVIARGLRRALLAPTQSGGALRGLWGRGTGATRGLRAKLEAASGLVPNTLARRLCVEQRVRMYNAAFFDEGRFAVAGSQDATIRIFRSGGPWALAAEVEAQDVAWTVSSVDVVTGASSRLLYATMSPVLHLADLGGCLLEQQADSAGAPGRARAPEVTIDLSRGSGAGRRGAYSGHFGVYQARFAPGWAGNEAVAACSDNRVRVVDVETGAVVLTVVAHADDINAVCFADPAASANVFISASDDGTVRTGGTEWRVCRATATLVCTSAA